MKRTLIGGRYQYSPAECLAENEQYRQFRAYDKVTKRDLLLQIHSSSDGYIDKLRDIKHTFVQAVFDVVTVEQTGQVHIFFQSGAQCYLSEALANTRFLMESDALVILKFLLLATQELHEKMVISHRICAENVVLCNHSIIKLASALYPSQLPLEAKAPEILLGEHASHEGDIYSLGVVFYQMLYGCYPFAGDTEQEILSQIKGKKFQVNPTSSPLKIIVSKEINALVRQMLDYYPKNRPQLEQILAHTSLNFPVETQAQTYIKPKGSLIPEPFLKKYLVFRATKTTRKYDNYYEESNYLALSLKDREFITLIVPDVKMFETEPRKIESYFQKLRAVKDSYMAESCGFLCRIDDYQRFRREPVLATEYCNQGDLYSYLEKRKQQMGWLSEKEIYILMYLIALGYKQMRDLGVTSIHTVNSQRIMIRNSSIKLRQPGLLTPLIEAKLRQSDTIDYFAPQLKSRGDFVELDKSDMWSFGILFYYLLHKQLPQINPETSTINIDILDTNRKNKNIIGRCLDQNVQKRLTLDQVRIEGVNQELLEEMLEQKKKQDEADEEESEEEEGAGVGGHARPGKSKHVIFKSRKTKWCKNYNKIICRSSTNTCRLYMKILLGLVLLWALFFGIFFVNGGVGLLRTNFYRKITLQVPRNYATSLYNMTILSNNGLTIQQSYSDYSYEQFTVDLNCTQNNHTMTSASKNDVSSYINYSHSVQCFFGFVYAFLISIVYIVMTYKLDLPTILTDKKQKKQDNKNIYHHLLMQLLLSSTMFCFFYLFALEYMIQMEPCLGIENQAYPQFTSIESVLNGDMGIFMSRVFTTVVLWSILMIGFGIASILVKRVFVKVYDVRVIVGFWAIMGLYTVVCRIGFGSDVPLEPTWSYKMNEDILSQYWGLFGFFPELVVLIIYAMQRLVDCLFWFFLRLGMQPDSEQDIRYVQFNAKLEPSGDYEKIDKSQTNIGAIENQFEIFD